MEISILLGEIIMDKKEYERLANVYKIIAS